MDGPWTQFAPAAPDAPAAPLPAADGPWTLFAPNPPLPASLGVDDLGRPIPAATPAEMAPLRVPQPIVNIAAAAAEGAKQGFGSEPLGLSPQGEEGLVRAGVYNGPGEYNPLKGINRAVVGGVAATGDLAVRGMQAGLRGLQGGIAQTGEEVGAPILGRDLAALPEALIPETRAIPHGPAGESSPPRSMSDIYAPPRVVGQSTLDRINQLIRHDDAEIAVNNGIMPPITPPEPSPLQPALVANPAALAVNAPAFVPPGARIPPPAAPDFLPPASAVPSRGVVPPSTVRNTLAGDIGDTIPSSPQNALATFGPPASVAPTAATGGAPVPASVGAAASRDLTNPNAIAMRPREAAASQATGESWRLAQPAVQGEDKTQYVKGVVPTAAETSGNADIAGEQKYLVQTPGMAEQNRLQQTKNNDARIDHYDDLAGTQTIVNTMAEARDAQAQKDLTAAWSKKAAVNAQPVVDQIDRVLSGPQGKLTAVKNALTAIRNTLHDAEGNLESDPETLYGVRREVANMLGKAAQVEKPTLKDAARQIGSVKDLLDQTIEAGAPGYKQYLDNYSAASRPINARQLLLDARPDLTSGSERMMTFGKVDRLMKGIVGDRQASGINQAKSLDDATMEGLWNLHSDLKRQNNVDLGRPRGSDTTSLLRRGASMAGLGAAHMVANTLLPVVGPFMVKQGHEMLEKRQLQARMNQLMDGMNFTAPKD